MDFEKDILQCISILQSGGLILYPTDTIWGIGCDATNADAVNKIYALKNRPESKSLIVLLADEKEILKHVSNVDLRIFDFLSKTKKPTTVVYEDVIGVADNLISPNGSVAIRLVNDEFCKHLIKRFRKPIVSTSANISGEATPKTFNEITNAIKLGVNYVVQHRQNDNSIKEPSSVVKWSSNGEITVLRP